VDHARCTEHHRLAERGPGGSGWASGLARQAAAQPQDKQGEPHSPKLLQPPARAASSTPLWLQRRCPTRSGEEANCSDPDIQFYAIQQTQERFDITSIVISHDMASTFRIGHLITMLYQGQIVAFGSPAAETSDVTS
jgi:hypothetical protein